MLCRTVHYYWRRVQYPVGREGDRSYYGHVWYSARLLASSMDEEAHRNRKMPHGRLNFFRLPGTTGQEIFFSLEEAKGLG